MTRVDLIPMPADLVPHYQENALDDIRRTIAAVELPPGTPPGIPLLRAYQAKRALTKGYRPERAMLKEFGMSVFRWGLQPQHIVNADGLPVGAVATRYGERTPAGERYVSVFIIHIRLRHRRNGYAAAAYRAIAAQAVADGCTRLTTTAATFGGWAVHRALGWPAWGVNANRQIVTDTTLTGLPDVTLPARCERLTGPGRPLTLAEHARALTDPHGPYRLRLNELPAAYREALCA